MTPRLYLLLWLRRWHGRIGVAAAVFFVSLATTGIILNHATTLQLNSHRIHATWLARWYGLKTEHPTQGFAAKENYLVAANGAWLLNDRLVADNAPLPVGMVDMEGIIYVASADRLYLYSADGTLIEKLSGATLPAPPVTGIGITQSRIALRTNRGVYASDDGVDWKAVALDPVEWSQASAIPAAMQARAAERLTPGISAETLLLDIHSGRIVGAWGPLLVDIVALVLTGLAISGAVVFFRSHRRHPAITVNGRKR